jgi:molecular chaperone GrpE
MVEDNNDIKSTKEQEEKIIEQAESVIANLNKDLNEEVLKKLTDENNSLKEALLRKAAEFENLKKRNEKQLEDSAKFSIASFSKELLSVMDNLRRAIDNIPAEELAHNTSLKNLNEGIVLTKVELEKVFEKFSLLPIAPQVGDKFDHNLHQAVSQIEHPELKNGQIINVMQVGYQLHDRLLRAAIVTVAI